MNKKGFTLVELLAVIAILAILVIIALPNVLKMFNDSKKNSFINEVREVFKTAQNQYMASQINSTTQTAFNNACATKVLLDMQGRAASGQLKYLVVLTDAGETASVIVTDGTYTYEKTGIKDVSEITDADVSDGDGTAKITADTTNCK